MYVWCQYLSTALEKERLFFSKLQYILPALEWPEQHASGSVVQWSLRPMESGGPYLTHHTYCWILCFCTTRNRLQQTNKLISELLKRLNQHLEWPIRSNFPFSGHFCSDFDTFEALLAWCCHSRKSEKNTKLSLQADVKIL